VYARVAETIKITPSRRLKLRFIGFNLPTKTPQHVQKCMSLKEWARCGYKVRGPVVARKTVITTTSSTHSRSSKSRKHPMKLRGRTPAISLLPVRFPVLCVNLLLVCRKSSTGGVGGPVPWPGCTWSSCLKYRGCIGGASDEKKWRA
jgi:hypothetical protein